MVCRWLQVCLAAAAGAPGDVGVVGGLGETGVRGGLRNETHYIVSDSSNVISY